MTWELDRSHTNIQFAVKHMKISTVRGTFTDYDLKVEVDEQDLAKSSAVLRLAANSIDSGNADRDGHLKSADFFDAENHPAIVFETKNIERTGEDQYRVVGDLTIRGITKEVVFEGEAYGPFEDPFGGQRIALTAETEVDRNDWGLKWNMPLGIGGVMVGDKVKLHFDAELMKTA